MRRFWLSSMTLGTTVGLTFAMLTLGRAAQDQDDGNTLLYVIGGGAIIAGIALLASDNGNGNNSVGTTTGTTSTSTTTST